MDAASWLSPWVDEIPGPTRDLLEAQRGRISATWDEEVNPLELRSTYGVGARWKLRQLVNISLRLDLGYNPNTGEFKFYAGTSNMF